MRLNELKIRLEPPTLNSIKGAPNVMSQLCHSTMSKLLPAALVVIKRDIYRLASNDP